MTDEEATGDQHTHRGIMPKTLSRQCLMLLLSERSCVLLLLPRSIIPGTGRSNWEYSCWWMHRYHQHKIVLSAAGWMDGRRLYINGSRPAGAYSNKSSCTTTMGRQNIQGIRLAAGMAAANDGRRFSLFLFFPFLFFVSPATSPPPTFCAALVAKGKCRGDQLDSIRSLFSHQHPVCPSTPHFPSRSKWKGAFRTMPYHTQLQQ